jgi:tetratricopeptide (TPR) repeat protein
MQNNILNLPQNNDAENLEIVKGIRFTPREIDILACLLNGRIAKTIAAFLSLSPKTVEAHTRNIMGKLGCNSQEGVRDFAEKSGKYLALKEHYVSLLCQTAFEKSLDKIASLTKQNSPACFVTYDSEQKLPIVDQIVKHLKLAGAETVSEATTNEKVMAYYNGTINAINADYIIYIISQAQFTRLQKNDITAQQLKLFPSMQGIESYQTPILFLLYGNQPTTNVPQVIQSHGYIELNGQESYYLTFFEILQRVFSSVDIQKVVLEFKHFYETIVGTPAQLISQPETQTKGPRARFNDYKSSLLSIFTNNYRWHLASTVFCLVVVGISTIKFMQKPKQASYKHLATDTSVRSELVVPINDAYLNRPQLIRHIQEKLEKKGGIQTVALIGAGGAGKTTLARQYARLQKLPIVWEINAETKESFKSAYEKLAQVLSKTQEDQEKVRSIKEIKDPLEREEKILFFVREHLSSSQQWLLIYDNVENFTDIQKYFPSDSSLWGAGKIIITTRDEHIQSHSQVNHAIHVGELEQHEKLALFNSILQSEQDKSNNSPRHEQTESFLQKIPSFPLDVSLAGYYIKATNITYSKYLNYLYNNNSDFSSLQETVLKDTSNYSKTRYRIISLSLKEILTLNKTFTDLLLLISLLDSQHIPKELLDAQNSDVAVDSLIYHLKKYSLISSHLSHSTNTTYVIHRSTQEIILNHLIKILDLEKSKESVARVLRTFIKYMSDILDQEDLPLMKTLIVHGERVLTHKYLLSDTTKGQILGELGYIYYYIGDFIHSRESLERGLAYLKNSSDKNYGGIARILTYLGKLSWALGNYERAKSFFNESIHVSKTHLFEDHIEVAHALADLGLVYRYEGNNEKARALTNASLKIYVKHLSRRDVRLGSVLGNLGIIHMNLGDYKQAEVFLDQSLQAYKSYSEEHIGVGWAKAYLGNVQSLLGDYQKAKDLLEQSLTFYKKHLSENHVGIARDLNFLGVLYIKTKEYGKAKAFLKQSLKIFRKNFKEDHPDVIKVLATLSEIETAEKK